MTSPVSSRPSDCAWGAFDDVAPWVLDPNNISWEKQAIELRVSAQREVPVLTTPTRIPPVARLVVSRNRATREAVIVAEALDCDVARLGSAGAKTMAVVLGEVDIYVHAGGMYQWDSAAPIAVAAAAGLFTSRIDGTPLVYNRRDAWLPDLVVCQQHLAQQVIDALRAGRLGA